MTGGGDERDARRGEHIDTLGVRDDAMPSMAFPLAPPFASFSAALLAPFASLFAACFALFALSASSASLRAEPRRYGRERHDDESCLHARRVMTNRAMMMRHETTSSEITTRGITTLEILMRDVMRESEKTMSVERVELAFMMLVLMRSHSESPMSVMRVVRLERVFMMLANVSGMNMVRSAVASE